MLGKREKSTKSLETALTPLNRQTKWKRPGPSPEFRRTSLNWMLDVHVSLQTALTRFTAGLNRTSKKEINHYAHVNSPQSRGFR